ncbi:hypothetical protein [Actinokineospora terrae]|uniref:Uncharacterized protein n=1 Tax=Actinokineospora terrae TaxID=155974 RepID=A0A1H9S8D0_9PSEU|nr:hypothetical protein [Actinokineospora terrae]SER80643.1 hypothetical protein SAMN04487818_105299 [Actinokineospora terrae]
MTATFLLLVLLAFSDEFLSAVADATQVPYAMVHWTLIVIDTLLLVLVAQFKRRFRLRVNGEPGRGIMAWWLFGATLTLTTDALAIWVVPPRTLWFDLVSALIYALGLAMLVSTTIDTKPMLLVSAKTREALVDEWSRLQAAVPLLVGTTGAYLATVWWEYMLQPTSGVEQEFFAQMSQVIPLLIVALGLEARFYHDTLNDPTIAMFSLAILCFGEVFALSALVPNTRAIYDWHSYVAFLVTVEACFVALVTLVWVLVVRDGERPAAVPGAPPATPAVPPAQPARTGSATGAVVGAAVVAAAVVGWVLRRR